MRAMSRSGGRTVTKARIASFAFKLSFVVLAWVAPLGVGRKPRAQEAACGKLPTRTSSNAFEHGSTKYTNDGERRNYCTAPNRSAHKFSLAQCVAREVGTELCLPRRELFIVDASYELFRAHYGMSRAFSAAIAAGTADEALPALYGALLSLRRLLSTLAVDPHRHAVVFAFEGTRKDSPSFRKTLFPAYKANRAAAPPGISRAFPLYEQLVTALGFPAVSSLGFEADDVVAQLVRVATSSDEAVSATIVSADKDFQQLLKQDRVRIVRWDAKKSAYSELDEAAFRNQSGGGAKDALSPQQFADVLALMGDTADNIPGVAGIGPKTAQKLIATYGTLSAMYENIESVRPTRVRELLKTQKDNAELSLELAKLGTTQPPLGEFGSWRALQRKDADQVRCAELFRRVGLREPLLAELLDSANGENSARVTGAD
mmetsp:Transcript_13367/g.35934  ORF Transcript_13367/g.35934 Transcript_13367/m.35934 type:complete len:431 (-) Transcript_13367:611-1903(-)